MNFSFASQLLWIIQDASGYMILKQLFHQIFDGNTVVKASIGFNIYSLLGVLEQKHNLLWADGLHRQVLMSVLEAHISGVTISNQQVVDKGFTSRSSTYRKIAELKQLGFLCEKWNNAACNLELGPAALELIKDAEKDIYAIFKANT